ncbi:MAG: efflux RND transporter periplasmic adaptor subunit [Roseovarius sp.]
MPLLRPLLAALLSAGLCHAAAAQEAGAPAPRLAKIVEVQSRADAVTRRFFGTVAAKETVDLAFQVGGQVVELPVIEGDPVPEGALLAQLDLEPFQLALDQARVQKQQADRNLERLQKLEGSTVSQVTVDDARTQADLAAIAVRDAERSLEQATLKAPFDGLVAARKVAKFTTISPGTPVVRLHDMSDLRVEIDVPEVLFQRAGRDPDIELFATFPASDRQFPLEVREFNAETSDIGQTFRITLGMAPPKEIVVLPGSSVEVTATLNQTGAFIEIPAAAIVFDTNGKEHVMVFEPAGAAEGVVRRVPVETAATNAGKVRVISGLEPGQEIVGSGAALLSDGEQVARFTGFPK